MKAGLRHGKTIQKSKPVENTSNVISLSRTTRVEVEPEKLAHAGVLIPGSDWGVDVQSAYNALAAQVMRFASRRKLRSLLVTSPAGDAGTTVTAINLALQMARHVNRTAILVDLNFRRPSIHRYFGYSPEYGIADCIRGKVPFEKILFSPVDRLTIAPAGKPQNDTAGLLAAPVFMDILEEVVSRYPERLVILDTPPVAEWGEISALVPEIDASLLVVRAGRTQARQVERAMRCLRGTQNISVVLTGAREW